MDFWWLTELTPEAAEAHDRRVHNAEDPSIRLGWIPYTLRATHNTCAAFACHHGWELDAKLKRHGLKIAGWGEWRDGVRSTRLVYR